MDTVTINLKITWPVWSKLYVKTLISLCYLCNKAGLNWVINTDYICDFLSKTMRTQVITKNTGVSRR